MGLDMSFAFDTIRRETVFNSLNDAGCDDDDMKLVRLLLSNIKTRIKVNRFSWFLRALSVDHRVLASLGRSKLHYIWLQLCIIWEPWLPDKHQSWVCHRKVNTLMIWILWTLALTVNVYNSLPVVTDIFSEWNLQTNETKTELLHQLHSRSLTLSQKTPSSYFECPLA